ncbi:MAG: zinc ribbon domain-containing protein [SAR324 cluster bacterium]|nr:zinc ribbon domain-containing protein [SAR324 cluster bacterium]
MDCPNCGFENSASAKFCSECAAPLQLICPQCGHSNASRSRFCNEYAVPLAADRLQHVHARRFDHCEGGHMLRLPHVPVVEPHPPPLGAEDIQRLPGRAVREGEAGFGGQIGHVISIQYGQDHRAAQ